MRCGVQIRHRRILLDVLVLVLFCSWHWLEKCRIDVSETAAMLSELRPYLRVKVGHLHFAGLASTTRLPGFHRLQGRVVRGWKTKKKISFFLGFFLFLVQKRFGSLEKFWVIFSYFFVPLS